MTTRQYEETFFGDNQTRNLVADHDKKENCYANPNYVADRTADTPVQQTQLPQNTDQRDYEHRYETKKFERKWLLIFFVIGPVIITGMFVAAIVMTTAAGNVEDGKDQQIKTIQENLEKNLTSMTEDVHVKDQQMKKILENLERNLTSLTNEVFQDGKDQQLKTLQENLEKNLTSIIDDDYAKDQQTKKIIENLQRNITSLTNKVDLLLLLNVSKTIDGWFLASDGLHYKLFSEGVNYTTAKSHCENVGGMLLTKGLRSASVFREIEENLLPSMSMKARTWIGFYELAEGDWHWLDGGATNSKVVVWHEGEPNNNGGRNEACGNILRISLSKAEINDDTCTFTLPFVCER